MPWHRQAVNPETVFFTNGVRYLLVILMFQVFQLREFDFNRVQVICYSLIVLHLVLLFLINDLQPGTEIKLVQIPIDTNIAIREDQIIFSVTIPVEDVRPGSLTGQHEQPVIAHLGLKFDRLHFFE